MLVLPTPGMPGVEVFADELEKVVARYGIEVHKNSELVEIDGPGRTAIVRNNEDQSRSISSTPPRSGATCGCGSVAVGHS